MLSLYRSIFLPVVVILACPSAFSQNGADQDKQYLEIFQLARKNADADHQLLNGIYYENPYYDARAQLYILQNGVRYANPNYNANWHPVLNDGKFHEGTIIYQHSKFTQVPVKYDIYHQQIVIRPDPDDPMLMIVLSNQFVSEFWIGESHFIKSPLNEHHKTFFQVVHKEQCISGFRAWHKLRYESFDEGNKLKYHFGSPRYKSYLEVEDTTSFYKNNSSFLRLLPGNVKDPVRNYMKSEKIRINKADTDELGEILQYVNELMSHE